MILANISVINHELLFVYKAHKYFKLKLNMYWFNGNKYTAIKVKFQTKSPIEAIVGIIKNGANLNFEYVLSTSIKESVLEYLSTIPSNEWRSLRVFVNDTGFELNFYVTNDHLSMTLNYFGDFFTIRADYDECDEPVFDTIKYLDFILFLSKNLIIKKLKVVENTDVEHDPEFTSYMKESVQNTISAFIGSTYYLKSPYQYLICLVNNIIENDGQIKNDCHYTDANDLAKYLAAQLIENTENGILLPFIMKDQLFELTIYPENLTLKPIGDLKKQTLDNKAYVDIAFYTHIFMHLCKDLGIRDMETYFDRRQHALPRKYRKEFFNRIRSFFR
jgi:hypothetical protein